MAISPFKTFSPGEILTASDLNASFIQITSNGEDLGFPATKSKDFNGFALILDADADSSLAAGADDVATLTLQGVGQFIFDGDVASPVNGITFTGSATGVAPSIIPHGTDANISTRLGAKGTGNIELEAGGSETDILVLAEGSQANIALRLQGKGTGQVELGDALLSFPDADGAAGAPIVTDGAGALSFGALSLITGDRITFQQTTPSAAFTKDTGVQTNSAFRLQTGTATSDLAGNTFTVAFGSSRATGTQSSNHTHTNPTTGTPSATTDFTPGGTGAGSFNHTHAQSATGSNSLGHTHTLNMAVDYYDLVIGEVT